jgi:hypothetical protein
MSEPAGQLTVHRTHDQDVRQRQVVLRLDGGPPVTLMFGDSYSTAVAPGPHELAFHNTLVRKKVRFDVAPGTGTTFDVINKPGRLTLGFLSLLGVAPLFLEIRQRP